MAKLEKKNNKIELDKYYTQTKLAKYVADKTREIIGTENITEYLEPSAGAGVFLDFLDKKYLAYDIAPENDKIKKQDYLKLELQYKKGRCAIGNPPFGESNNLIYQFYNKLINECDYISFILPITMLNNTIRTYKFDLVYSEDLGEQLYSNRPIKCCLNIFKRPKGGGLGGRPDYLLNEVDIKVSKSHKHCQELVNANNYDLRLLAWGSPSKTLKNLIRGREDKILLKEIFIYIKSEEYRKQIIEVLEKANWYEIVKPLNPTRISICPHRVYKYLKSEIPELTLKSENQNKLFKL